MDLKSLLFSLKGRIPRSSFWIGILICAGITLGGVASSLLVASLTGGVDRGFWMILLVPVAVAYFWMTLALTVKRLHDRDRSGWMYLVYIWLPGALDRFSLTIEDTVSIWALTLIVVGIGVWALIDLGFLKGSAGRNAYGPDPLEIEDQPQTLEAATEV